MIGLLPMKRDFIQYIIEHKEGEPVRTPAWGGELARFHGGRILLRGWTEFEKTGC
jgi:hypothetical protein